MNRLCVSILPVALVLFCVTGCNVIAPPFDASGVFDGAWQATIIGGSEEAQECVVTLELTHDTGASVFENLRVDGTAYFNFTCPMLADEIADLGLPATLEIKLVGAITPDGRVVLGALETGGENTVVFGTEATGEDFDANGSMDEIRGAFDLYIDPPRADTIVIRGAFDAVHSE